MSAPVPGTVLKILLGDGAKVVLEGQKVISSKLKNFNFDYIVLSPGIDKTSCSLRKYLKINNYKLINRK